MPAKTMINTHVRWMIRRDMKEVLQIEKNSFEEIWIEEDFLSVLKERENIGMVAEVYLKVVGFYVYQYAKTKLTILDFAVDPDSRRSGVGTQLINKLKSKLRAEARTKIYIDVRESNLGTQLFFKKMGFKAIKILFDHYSNGESAYRFRYKLGDENE